MKTQWLVQRNDWKLPPVTGQEIKKKLRSRIEFPNKGGGHATVQRKDERCNGNGLRLTGRDASL